MSFAVRFSMVLLLNGFYKNNYLPFSQEFNYSFQDRNIRNWPIQSRVISNFDVKFCIVSPIYPITPLLSDEVIWPIEMVLACICYESWNDLHYFDTSEFDETLSKSNDLLGNRPKRLPVE